MSSPAVIRAMLFFVVLWQLSIGSLYASMTPRWQSPDEPAHFNYLRQIADGRGLPVLDFGDYDQAYLERLKAQRFPSSLSVESIRYEGHQPPAYYLIAAALVRLSDDDLGRQLLLVRLFSVVLGGILVLLLFAITRIIVPARPDLALLAAAFPALVPQHIAIFASASNDSLASVAVSLSLLLVLRIVSEQGRRGRPPATRSLLALGLALALCVLTKTTAYVAVPVALVGLFRVASGTRAIRTLVVALAPPTVALAVWMARNGLLYGPLDPLGLARHDAIVAGQPLSGALGLDETRRLISVGFQSFWGQFGWMGVLMDGWVYALLWAFSLVAIGGFVCFLWDVRRLRVVFDAAGLLALSLVGLTFVLVSAGFLWYNLHYVQPQGRYFFAAMPAIAFVVATGIRWAFSERYGIGFAVVTYCCLAVLDLAAIYRYILPQLAG